MPPEIRMGRSVADGHRRGWGLEFGDLHQQISADPFYRAAFSLIEGRSVQAELKRMNLYLLLRMYLPKIQRGAIIEFGCYRGGSIIFMAAIAKRLFPGVEVFGFDTFKGMPATDGSIDAHRAGDFGDADLAELRTYAAQLGLGNLHFVEGVFQETAADILHRFGPVAMCHIDCDIRSAVEYSYEITKPYMVPGGYWVFDDPLYSSCLGAFEAVEEVLIRRDGLNAEQVFPHLVFRAP